MLIDELRQQKEECHNAINLMNKLQRLQTNPDFEELILDGFCEKECARYARLSGDPEVPESLRVVSGESAKASGVLMRYIQNIIAKGMVAQNDLEEIEQAIVESEMNVTGDDYE